MFNAHVRAVRDLRNSYAELAELVKNSDHVIITNNGKSESVLISIDEFSKYEEFIHLRYVEQKLREAETEIKDGRATWLSHEDFWSNVRKLP